MKARVQCFMLEPTGDRRIYLRRFGKGAGGHFCTKWKAPSDWHSKRVHLRDEPITFVDGDPERWTEVPMLDHSDPRWPTHCKCGFAFTPEDDCQMDQERLYKRSDTGEVLIEDSAPPGAMWYADWYAHKESGRNIGPDGRCLVVRLPDGVDWIIDSRASNCDRRDVRHNCWKRTGTPPNVNVTKGGPCTKGAGSILTEKYHGHLRNGWLVQC